MTITADTLKKYETKLSAQANTYAENQAYVDGKNPTLLSKRPGKEPDNRVPVPLAKSSIIDMVGYMGRPGDINAEYHLLAADETAEKDDEYISKIREWNDANDDDLEVTELLREALAHGVAYELWWDEPSDKQGYPVEPQWKIVPGNSIILIKDKKLKPKTLAAIRYWRDDDDAEKALVYLPFAAEGWKKVSGKWERDTESDITYCYSNVPVIEFTVNRERQCFFEAQKEIIDAIDNLLSKSCNEVDRYNALVALFPGKVDKAFVDKLIELKVIDDLGQFEHWPEYLEKNLAGVQSFYTDLSNRLERLFYETLKIARFSDENFAANASGIAMAYKLLGMEFQAALAEAYFIKGLYDRKSLYDDVFRVATSSPDVDAYTVTVTCRRNVPVDEAGKLQIALQMAALGMSKETIIKYLPTSIIPDYERELSNINLTMNLEDETSQDEEQTEDQV